MPGETRSLTFLLANGAAAEPAFVFDGTAVSTADFARPRAWRPIWAIH
jgi:hypothetical protein